MDDGVAGAFRGRRFGAGRASPDAGGGRARDEEDWRDGREGARGRRLAASATLAGAVLLSAGPAGAAGRVALVIGNGAYEHAAPLANPGNDARAVGDAFERLGYTVTRLMDADYDALRKGLRRFKQAARGKEVAVVFYAGHGIGVAGRNFLVPVDAELGYADAVEDEAIPLDRLMSAVGNTRHLDLVILDACRNNPFVASMKGSRRSIDRGLARVETTGKTMVAYAAKHGKTADDGDGTHSPYTEALLQYLEAPGLEVRKLFGKVHDAVVDTSKRRGRVQEPWTYEALGDATSTWPRRRRVRPRTRRLPRPGERLRPRGTRRGPTRRPSA